MYYYNYYCDDSKSHYLKHYGLQTEIDTKAEQQVLHLKTSLLMTLL